MVLGSVFAQRRVPIALKVTRVSCDDLGAVEDLDHLRRTADCHVSTNLRMVNAVAVPLERYVMVGLDFGPLPILELVMLVGKRPRRRPVDLLEEFAPGSFGSSHDTRVEFAHE